MEIIHIQIFFVQWLFRWAKTLEENILTDIKYVWNRKITELDSSLTALSKICILIRYPNEGVHPSYSTLLYVTLLLQFNLLKLVPNFYSMNLLFYNLIGLISQNMDFIILGNRFFDPLKSINIWNFTLIISSFFCKTTEFNSSDYIFPRDYRE